MFHNDYSDKSKQWNLTKPTRVRSLKEGLIRLHLIKDVVYSGKKEVSELELQNGRRIKLTQEHKVMTEEGWKQLRELNTTDRIMCDTLLPQRNGQKSYKIRDGYVTINYHKYINKMKRISPSILTYEASMNGLEVMQYLDVLWNDEKAAEKLKFIDAKKYEVHHDNGNHFDNSISNLRLMTRQEHKELHADNSNFNQGIPEYSTVKKITKIGIKKTYDIICDDPYRNFVANGIIIHNSGKSACAIRETVIYKHMKYYTNILPKKPRITSNIITIEPEMIIKRTVKDVKKKRDGSEENVYEYELNKEFWTEQAIRPLSVMIDEAHDYLNARKSMSKINEILGSFLALARRIVGETDGEGDLIFITQLDRRIDVICREMAHQIRWHVCHYRKTCLACGLTWYENSDFPEKIKLCPACGNYKLRKHSFKIECFHYANISAFDAWKQFGMSTFHKRYYINDIEKYFPLYDTLQWENLFKDLY